MKDEGLKNKAEEPSAEYLATAGGHYSYADYLTWEFDDMVELIKGKVFRHAAAPRVNHQRVAGSVFYHFYNFLKGKK